MRIKTYAPTNQFHFNCPIFKVETSIAVCLKLRDMLWMGKSIPQRQGCQACMRASKCPVVAIVADIQRTGDDPYYATDKQVGALSDRHLSRIHAVRVMDLHMRSFTLTERERELILAANEAAGIERTFKKEPAPKRRRTETVAAAPRERTARAVETSSPTEAPKPRGNDYAAAINRELEKGAAA